MIRRIIVVATSGLLLGLLLTIGVATVAYAVPGEGFDIAPYGTEDDSTTVPNGTGRPDMAPDVEVPETRRAPTTVEEATSVSVLTFVLSIVVATAVMTIGGWFAGASHERRALAH